MKMPRVVRLLLILALLLSLGGMAACGGGSPTPTPTQTASVSPTPTPSSSPLQTPTPTASPTGTPVFVEANDSIVGARLVAVRSSSSPDFRWEMDIEIYTSSDLPGVTNLTKDKVGKTITAKTNQYLLGFSIGQGINSHIRLEGGLQGTYYYAWDIK